MKFKSKKYCVKKSSWSKNLASKKCWVKKFFGQTNLGSKTFWVQKNSGFKIIFSKTKFWVKQISVQNKTKLELCQAQL